MALTQQELERKLLDAANSLRGPVDPADFKQYVFPLLFLKRLSDNWDAEQKKAAADYAPAAVPPEAYADYHIFVIPDGCHWADLKQITENVGRELQIIMDRIQEANVKTLAGIFGEVAWAHKERLPEHALVGLIDIFSGIALDPETVDHDMLGQAYEYLLKEFAEQSGKKAGEFFTPRAVVRLLTRVLDPRSGESIYDPACGSAGMLIEAVNEVRESGGDTRTLRLYGQEVNLTTAAIARMNLFMHDIEDFRVIRGDTLREPKFRSDAGDLTRFDVVIANPPFSLKNWGADAWGNDAWGRSFCGVPPAKNGDWAWIQHMLKSVAPGGRVGVVMPHGALFRRGAEAPIRECIARSSVLDAVIGLPPSLFYSTPIPACLLIFGPPDPDREVLYVNAARRYTKNKKQNVLTEEDIQAVALAYKTRGAELADGLEARSVPTEEIESNNWELKISRYLPSAAEDVVDVESALDELAASRSAAQAAEERLLKMLGEIGYG